MPDFLTFDPKAKPTRETFGALVKHLEDVWRDADEARAQADAFYFQTNDIWEGVLPSLKASRPQSHSGKAVGLIDHAVDAYLAFEPRWHRRPAGEGEAHKLAADSVEKALAEVVNDAFLKQQSFPPKVNGKQLARFNYTQLYVGLDLEALEIPVKKSGEDAEDFDRREWEWESSRSHWNPIVIEAPAPGEVLMDPWSKVPPVAIRRRTMRSYELAALMERQGKRPTVEVVNLYTTPGDPYAEVEVEEWWSVRYYSMRHKGGDLLWAEANPWGIQPYAQVFGGAADLKMGEKPDPKWYVRQAMLFRVMDDLKMHSQAMAASHEIIIRAAFAKTIYDGDASEAARQLEGDIMSGKKDQWGIEVVPELAREHGEHTERLAQNIEEATYNLQAAGFRQPGTQTATENIMLAEATNRTFKANVRQMEDLYSIGGSNILKLWKRVAEDYDEGDVLQIGEHPLKAKDIGEHYWVTAKFEQIDPVVALQEKQAAMLELQAGLIDEDTYYKVARYEDPSGIRKGRFKDMVWKMPEVMALGVIAALREAGFAEMADMKEQELKMMKAQQGQMLMGPDGRTPIGGAPQPPQSQNGRG